MDEQELANRLRRIYAALDATVEEDLDKLEGRFINTDNVKSVFQDFSGGLSLQELENLAFSLISNIAHLEDHLKRWASRNCGSKDVVDDAVDNSLALKIVKDLSNADKHGYPPRDGGRSGQAPRLEGVRRSLKITAAPKKGVEITLGPRGTPQVAGDGSAKAVLNGDVLDRDGNRIGELMDLATQAIAAWENLARSLGLEMDCT